MHVHGNAAPTVRQRRRLCDLVAAGVTVSAAARVVGCSRQTASKWVNRGRRGEPLRIGRAARIARRGAHRRRSRRRSCGRGSSSGGAAPVGWAVGIAASTVHAVLRRHGRSRLVPRPDREQVIRYEYSAPGGLIHVDIKKLGRILKPGHRVTGDRRGQQRGRPAGSTCSSPSTTAPGSRSRPSTRTRPATAPPVPRRARHLPRRPRHRCEAGTDRQRQLLQTPLGGRPRRPRHRREEDTPIPAPDQRESGTVHPHDARTLGLRLQLRQRTARLDALAPSLDFYNRFRPHRALNGSHRSSASTTCLGQTADMEWVCQDGTAREARLCGPLVSAGGAHRLSSTLCRDSYARVGAA